MRTFAVFLEQVQEIQVDGATIEFIVNNDIATIVGFDRLPWHQPGVIAKVIQTIQLATGKKVKTSDGIRQHWAHAGYTGL